MGNLKAGVARVNITPYVGIWLAGFAARSRPSEFIHDELYARALVLDDGGENITMVTCDLLTLDQRSIAAIREMAAAWTGLEGDHILISTTHTHSAPLSSHLRGFGPLDPAWLAVLEKKLAGAIALASRNMRQATVGAGRGEAKINLNRRGERALDQELGVLRVDDAHGRPLAVLMNYPCHPVVVPWDRHAISADYPGYAVSVIESAYEGTVGMFFTGACGDLNPTVVCGSFADVERLGRIVGAEALKVAEQITDPAAEVTLGAANQQVILKSQEIPTAERLQAIVDAGSQAENADLDWQYQWARDALEHAKAGKRSADVPIEIQAFALGDEIAMVGMPGEVFTEIGLRIKERAPFEYVLPIECTNGCIGYMPTPEAFDKGGYEADSAFKLFGIHPVDRDVAAKVTEAAARLTNRLKASLS